jgi:predicted nuclease of predicted toxin-antitoxin system
VKLLFDENLSPKLAQSLGDKYPGSVHVRSVGLRGADDERIWNHARSHNFVIVSKDTDFREQSFLKGFPPKVIWLDVGNAGTVAITDLLRREYARVNTFETDSEASMLVLSIGRGAG